jgi:hypothetical protein
VPITRLGKVQCPLQLQLPCRTVQEICSADHICDTLIRIVHDDAELIGEKSVATADHDISEPVQVQRAVALDAVGEIDPAAGDSKARRGGSGVAGTLTAGPGVPGIALGRDRLARTAALKRVTLLPQLLQRRLVQRQAGGLVYDIPVPEQVQGDQGLEDVPDAAGDDARGVQIFDPDPPAPAMVAGVQVAAERCDQRPQVQAAGGRGGEAAGVGLQR